MKKHTLLLLLIQFFPMDRIELTAQSKLSFEQLALNHVVDLLHTEKVLTKSKVFCNGLTESESSSFALLGDCLGLYSLFQEKQNQEYVSFFEQRDSLLSTNRKKVKLKLKKPLKKLHCLNKNLRERDYLFKVFRFIEYEENVYVEIQLVNNNSGYIHYFVAIDPNDIEATVLCRRSYIY